MVDKEKILYTESISMTEDNDIKFSSPALVEKLDQLVGNSNAKEEEDIVLREAKDVEKFLKEKEEWQNKSTKTKIIFI